MDFPIIQHPDWLDLTNEKWDRTYRLYKSGHIPPKLAGWMFKVNLKHGLRAIYGSDWKAAKALLRDCFNGRILDLRFRLGLLSDELGDSRS